MEWQRTIICLTKARGSLYCYWSFHAKLHPLCDKAVVTLSCHSRGYPNLTGFYFGHISVPTWLDGYTILSGTVQLVVHTTVFSDELWNPDIPTPHFLDKIR